LLALLFKHFFLGFLKLGDGFCIHPALFQTFQHLLLGVGLFPGQLFLFILVALLLGPLHIGVVGLLHAFLRLGFGIAQVLLALHFGLLLFFAGALFLGAL